MLVKQYVRAVLELKPKAFVMENVEMLKSDVHRFYLRTDEIETVKKYGIETSPTEILLLEAEYYSAEIAQDIRNRNTVEARLWPEEDYKLLNIAYRQRKNLKSAEMLYIAIKKSI